MAVTLAQSATLSANDLQRGVVETFVIASPVLDRIPLLDINGNAYAYNSEATLPGVEFRAVNSAYAESTGSVTQVTESLVILGGDADVDRFIIQTRGNINDQRAIQTELKSKALAYKWQDGFINGDVSGDANSFDGLKKRLTGGQVMIAGAAGLAVLGADDPARHAFFDQLDALLALVPGGADVIYTNDLVLAKIKSSMRRLTMYTTEQDVFGRISPFYNGIPVIDIGTKADGTRILPQTETQGASNIASSIYAVKWSDNENTNGVAALNNGGIDVRDLGEQDSKSVMRTRIEWFTGMATFGRGAARMTGVLAS
jgi:hypothetical protein